MDREGRPGAAERGTQDRPREALPRPRALPLPELQLQMAVGEGRRVPAPATSHLPPPGARE